MSLLVTASCFLVMDRKRKYPLTIYIYTRDWPCISLQFQLPLKKHIPSPSRAYSCQSAGCLKTFQYPKDLRRHTASHTHEKKFACVCGRAYTREDNLKRHQASLKCLLPKEEEVEINDAVEHGQGDKDGHRQQTYGTSLHTSIQSSATGSLAREQSTPSEVFSNRGKTRFHDNRKSKPGFEGQPWACPEFRYQLSPQEHRCNQSFKDESRLTQHRRRIHNQFHCIKCLEPFSSEDEWRSHRNQLPHHCGKCSTCMTEDAKRGKHSCDINKRKFKYSEEVWQYLYERHYPKDNIVHNPRK